MDLDWDSVWEPDGEPADVPEPLWTVGPEFIEPSRVISGPISGPH